MLIPLMILALISGTGLALLPSHADRPQAPAGQPFLGQRLPGAAPEPFAPDLAPTLGMTRAPVFSSDGTEAFWTRSVGRFKSRLTTARLTAGAWSTPEPLAFSTGEFFDHNPAVSANGRRLVFASNRPIPGQAPATLPGTDVPASDLWVTERSGNAWSEPRPLGAGVNTTADEDCPVLAGDEILYFSSSRPSPNGSPGGIFRARAVGGGEYRDPERLPPPVSDAGEMVSGVGPQERYLLFYSMKRGEDGGLCVAFRARDGSWSRPVTLSRLLGDIRVYAAAVTPDGRWLFLSASGAPAAVYWVSASVLDPLHPGDAGREVSLLALNGIAPFVPFTLGASLPLPLPL